MGRIFEDLLNTTPSSNKTAQPRQEDTEQALDILKEEITEAKKSTGNNKAHRSTWIGINTTNRRCKAHPFLCQPAGHLKGRGGASV